MALSDEQAKLIKEQLFKQAEKFPEDKKQQVIDYIESMNNEELEEFVKKNQAMSGRGGEGQEEQEGNAKKSQNTECVYCLISNKQIESLAIYEDKDYLAVLEINPFSEGHTILIPKKHAPETKNLKPKAFSIADKIGKHLVKKLNAENFQITTSDDMKHAIVNIIPAYKGQKITFERKPADKKKLQELSMKIGAMIKKPKKLPQKTEADLKKENEKLLNDIIKLPRRIP